MRSKVSIDVVTCYMRVCAKLQSEIRSRKSVMCSDPQLGGWAPGVVRAPNWFEPVRSELYVSDEMLVDCAVMDTTWFFFDVFSLLFMSSYSEALEYHCRFDG